jgi:DHA1 family multidrug resistance protein-like MFS transporter
MIGVLGNALAQLIFGLSTQLWMLFAARALSGVLSSATLPTAMAYIGDSTSDEDRSGKMGIIGAAMGIGMVIGPGLGGWLATRSLSFPFFLASALSFLALLLVFLILPEPARSHSEAPDQVRGHQIETIWRALLSPSGILFLMAFLLSFGLTNFESIFGLYAAERYLYSPQQVGWILTIIGFLSALIQGALTGPATRRFGEKNVIRVSLISSAISFVLLTQASNLPTVLVTVCFFVVSNSMINPAVSSLISKMARRGQGMAMGLTNSFLSLGRIVGPLWAGVVYDFDINLPYLSGAFIMLTGFVIAMLWLRNETILADSPENLQI